MLDGRTRLRRTFGTLALIAAAWSATLALTRGVSFTIGALHISSHNARNPAIGALALLALAALCAPAGSRARTVVRDVFAPARAIDRTFPRLVETLRRILLLASRPAVLQACAIALVLLTLTASWRRGAYVTGGSDAFGYVSEAHLFATGRLRIDVPLAHAFPHVPIRALTPLGYRPAEDGTDTLVPTYAPGYPLVMAVAERLAGLNAVYVVMPILAAVAVWSTYRIGAQLVGPGVGLGAALLVFASPAFLFQLIGAPMSDVPAAGWWALSLSLLLRDRRWPTALAGAAAGAAILTRPNLLLVVVVLGAYLLWKAVRARDRREGMTRLALFSIPVVVGCLTVAAFNAAWYGSPLRSGYPGGLFSATNWDDNIAHFSQWLTETQTPLFFLGYLAPLVAGWLPHRTRVDPRSASVLLVGVALAVVASYLFYMSFDAWWYLRFLLPAYPVLAVLTCMTLAAITARLGRVARAVSVAVVIGAATFGLHYAKDFEVWGEYRYRIIGEWVRNHLPDRAIVVTSQHGGNVLYYSGRTIVRYDMVARGDYEAALDEIIAAGYHPYLVIDEWEMEPVRQLHGAGPRGAIDWPPIAVLPLANVRVWDLQDNPAAARASKRQPVQIPLPDFIRRRLP